VRRDDPHPALCDAFIVSCLLERQDLVPKVGQVVIGLEGLEGSRLGVDGTNGGAGN
jgi:hypothetical protein